MTLPSRKRLILLGLGAAVLLLIVYGFLPDPVLVETAPAIRGPMQVVVEEEGETQVENTFVVSSPVAAFARRIELEQGDLVRRGQEIVRLEPPRANLLDPRTQSEAAARVRAAEAGLTQAEQSARAAAVAAEQAAAEEGRVERLQQSGSATRQALEQARAEAVRTAANLRAAEAGVTAARAEVLAARAALASGSEEHAAVRQVLHAPVDGRVLSVRHRSEGMVAPGEPLLELGDTGALEVRVDVLSQDAVRIRPGTKVLFEEWGGAETLEGVVERVEPTGFTQVSSLGVQEQRVPVVAAITSPPAAREGLGAGYRVLARFVVWSGQNVLQVPTSALFRTEAGWAVFVVENGRAASRDVRAGQQTGLATEIVSGLRAGEVVIVHPGNDIRAGARVAPREDG